MKKHRLYPRHLAAFPRYHPPYPIPYALDPITENLTVVAQPSRWPAKTLPQAGVRFVHSPYVYEDPFLFSAQNIRYNTTEPLVKPLPYTYGFERQGSASQRQGTSMPTEELLTKNTTKPTAAPNPGLWGNIAKGLSSTFANLKIGENKKKRQARRDVRRAAQSSSSGRVSSMPFAGGFWKRANKAFTQAMVVKRQKTNLLNDLPPRTTNRFAQQVKQQMATVGQVATSIKPLQAKNADAQVAKKESSNTALIVGGSLTAVALLGGAAWWFKSKKAQGGQNTNRHIAQVIAAKPQAVDLQVYLTQNGIGLDEYYTYLSQQKGFTGNPLSM